ncbi:MAG: tyrosine-type recombinase/integrase [Deltaproteobacteria bacterium]|jgi:integrase|nr:tyrosine-type recombinase/integrase [Deltaproteobacteria bacterium]
MKPGQNFNHPKKGSKISVEPIRELKDIRSIKKLLKDNPRDYALFTIGINTNLRASDLCRITVGMVKDLNVGDELILNEKKTGKSRRITLNKVCVRAIQALISSFVKPRSDECQLFKGRQGDIQTTSVNYLVKKWCQMVNLKGKYGSHSKPSQIFTRLMCQKLNSSRNAKETTSRTKEEEKVGEGTQEIE